MAVGSRSLNEVEKICPASTGRRGLPCRTFPQAISGYSLTKDSFPWV